MVVLVVNLDGILRCTHLQVFLANVDFSSVVKNSFASGLRGRYFKIVPVSSNIRPCLRLELYGCRAGK